jgi:hypothetical protein
VIHIARFRLPVFALDQTLAPPRPYSFVTFTAEQAAVMIRLTYFLLALPVLAAVLFVANDRWDLSFIGTLAAVTLIVGFAVAATGWTIRHDV